MAPDAFRADKPAIELLIVEVQKQAMRAMPGVQLAPNDKQTLINFVRAGPAGWEWSPPVAQALVASQVRTGNGWVAL